MHLDEKSILGRVARGAGPMQILDLQEGLRRFAGPGHRNDPDMLEVGNGFTQNEDRTHFSMWCLLAAPLIAGNNVETMSEQTRLLLTNQEAIDIDQDSLGIQGFRFSKDSVEIWCRPLKNGDWAIGFLNRSAKAKPIFFEWKKRPIVDSVTDLYLSVFERPYHVRNIWTRLNLGTTESTFQSVLPSHDIILLRLSAKQP